MNDIDFIALGGRIKRVRLLRQITQEQLSELCTLASSYVGIIERADKKPSISTLVKIANALNVSLDYLLYDSLQFEKERFFSIKSDISIDCENFDIQTINTTHEPSTTTHSILSEFNALNLTTGAQKEEITLILKILANITSNYNFDKN